MKRIFLCGPMSGLPENNYPAFRAKAAELRAQGYHVEDPSENQLPPDTEPETEWEEYMKMSIRQMLTCEEVCMLPGWEKSGGARMEIKVWMDTASIGMREDIGPIGEASNSDRLIAGAIDKNGGIGTATVADVAKSLGKGQNTIRLWLKLPSSSFCSDNGVVRRSASQVTV